MSTTINQLSAADAVQTSDQIPVYSSENGDARKASLSLLRTFFQTGAVSTDDLVTQYAAPSATGFSVSIASQSTWLVLTPTAGFAAGTIVLPAQASVVDKQELLVNCTQAVTTLAINGNGATVTGAPTTLAANAFFRLRYEAVSGVWYRVG